MGSSLCREPSSQDSAGPKIARQVILADLFAVSVMSYAVMSNHFHVVLELRPDAAEKWTAEDVVGRKRGKVEGSEPNALARLGIASQRWEHDVTGVGNGYWRAIGTAQELIDKAIALGQQWLKGIGYARSPVAKAN